MRADHDTSACRGQPPFLTQAPAIPADKRVLLRAPAGFNRRWPHIALADPLASIRLRRLLDSAAAALGDIECRRVLTDFCSVNGQPLTDSMQLVTESPQEYLTFLYFYDGRPHSACDRGAFAYTTPGSRVIWVCAQHLERRSATNHGHSTAVIIHEMLHSLGLGENPPSSSQITAQVRKRCDRQIRER